MRVLSVVLLFMFGAVAAASGHDYTMDNRPVVVFKGGVIHQSPYPQGRRNASVSASDACWRDCTSSCNWKMEYCLNSADPDSCRPHLDGCDRTCQRNCRGISGGPFLGFVDW